MWFVYSPLLSLLYVLCRVGSMMVLGSAGSSYLATHADQLYSEIRSVYLGTEELETTEKRLVREYENRISEYTPTERRIINSNIHLCRQYRSIATIQRLDLLLRMPRKLRVFDPVKDGKALHTMLESRHYGTVVSKHVYRYIAVMATCYRYDLDVTIRPPFLLGPPGTGKTMMVRQVAEALDLPFLSVSPGSMGCLQHLFGYSLTGPTSDGPGVITEFLCNQTNVFGERYEVNTFPVILCFEEIEKYLSRNYILKCELLRLLSTEDDSRIKIDGLGGIHVPFNRFMIWFDANAPVTTSKDTDPVAETNPFMDRMQVIEFGSYPIEQKMEIAKQTVDKILKKIGREEEGDHQIVKNMIRHIVKNDKEAGVRTMKHNLTVALVARLAYQDGWTHYGYFN